MKAGVRHQASGETDAQGLISHRIEYDEGVLSFCELGL
jgi:hypothetical protein